MEFTGKSAIITGAGSGIGLTTAEILASRGANVVGVDINPGKAKSLVDDLQSQGKDALFRKADVSDPGKVEAVFSEVLSRHGKVDILVNCAGICRTTPVPEITPEEWDLVFAVNLKSTFLCCQQALKGMCKKKYGKIVNVASASAKMGGVAVGAHYSASKAGIICLTKSLALYTAPYNVNVNSVCPGPVTTPMTDAWGEEQNRSFKEKIPMKRYAEPIEIAEAICFLASDKSAYITGEILDVNGGFIMD